MIKKSTTLKLAAMVVAAGMSFPANANDIGKDCAVYKDVLKELVELAENAGVKLTASVIDNRVCTSIIQPHYSLENYDEDRQRYNDWLKDALGLDGLQDPDKYIEDLGRYIEERVEEKHRSDFW